MSSSKNALPSKLLGMVGCGSMGGMMSLMFAEHGLKVTGMDTKPGNIKALSQMAKDAKLDGNISTTDDPKEFAKSIASEGSSRVIIFSLPHGPTIDSVIDELEPFLDAGDVIIDGANEDWHRTEDRQGRLAPRGVHYVGCGVSGGYQAARHGPSLSPGGTPQALDLVMPLLEEVAAKGKNGKPCVRKIGLGGSGHFVKTVHNGIEQGMLGALAEIWYIMAKYLGMSYDEIGDVFAKWNAEGQLSDNYLIDIAAKICHTKNPKDGEYELDKVEGKVVQDVDNTEGTGVWTQLEAMQLHVPVPTLTASHQMRINSANLGRREATAKTLGSFDLTPSEAGSWAKKSEKDKESIIADLHQATYAAFLAAFVQGMAMIAAQEREKKWGIDLDSLTQVWASGCIIRSDAIAALISKAYSSTPKSREDLLFDETIASDLHKAFDPLKKIVLLGIENNANVPTLAATLEYIKYSGAKSLPTQFEEAQLDFFGHHNFDFPDDGRKDPVKGIHHFEWQPA